MTTLIQKPAIWLIILIVGLPQFSETVYTPSLPDIARALRTSDAMVEYTLTIYLFAFALGTLLWGRISDQFGRKLPLLLGLGLYCVGCIGCALSNSIEMLLLSRFIQAFGGSTGSILGQIICRDAFHGKERGILFSNIGVALSISPAIGPFIGGAMAEFVGWRGVFMALIVFGGVVWMQTRMFLPETHPKHDRAKGSMIKVTKSLIKDPKVLVYGGIIGGLNGIMFSYYGEGSFFLIEMLGMSPFMYGISFIFLALSAAIGCHISKYYVSRDIPLEKLVMTGLCLCTIPMFMLALCALSKVIHANQPLVSIGITLTCMSLFFAGMDIAKPSLLSKALDNYQHVIGTASSIFGFYYYLIIAIMTFIMATVRDGTLHSMPLFFLCVTVLMIIIFRAFIKKR